MEIGDRLHALREAKKLTQGEIEKRTGLLRAYISRLENGRTIPTLDTLEKLARALEVPMYQLMYDGERIPRIQRRNPRDKGWGSSGRDATYLKRLRRALGRVSKEDRSALLGLAEEMASKRKTANK
ncbi:MAG TPA: helix-turn-helix transcriptional regulator [Candidatus Acidoferrum sp.]|nr:helix-turn-helix transcriptional regulator [Candidatus Acidoferrum sp.]